MTTTPGPETYKELLLFLGTAGVIVPLFGRWKVSPVFGFLAAGVALGPFGLGALAQAFPWISFIAITNTGHIRHLAEFGVAFLLFVIELELSWARLMAMRKLVFGLGGLQVAVSSAALAIVAFALGQIPASAAVLGSALALSSTAIILPSLAERKPAQFAGWARQLRGPAVSGPRGCAAPFHGNDAERAQRNWLGQRTDICAGPCRR
jgi:monovalent cation:H+ antiporter-2, CPA2 family